METEKITSDDIRPPSKRASGGGVTIANPLFGLPAARYA